MNIIFVKHGTKYNHRHVNTLYNQLVRYYPDANFFCYTEDPTDVIIPTIPCLNKPSLKLWWNKLAMFADWFPVEGKCLFFDLDMDVRHDPSDFIEWDGLKVIHSYWKEDLYMAPHAYDVLINSSVVTWTAGEQNHIWDHFMTNRDYFMRKYSGIDRFLVHEGFDLNKHPNGIVNSVKNKYMNAPIDMYNGLSYEL